MVAVLSELVTIACTKRRAANYDIVQRQLLAHVVAPKDVAVAVGG